MKKQEFINWFKSYLGQDAMVSEEFIPLMKSIGAQMKDELFLYFIKGVLGLKQNSTEISLEQNKTIKQTLSVVED